MRIGCVVLHGDKVGMVTDVQSAHHTVTLALSDGTTERVKEQDCTLILTGDVVLQEFAGAICKLA